MYYPYFISYMLAGVAIALVVFAWAIKNGQFYDQQRARFLPLFDAPHRAPVRSSRVSRIEVFALFALVIIGLCTSFAVVIFALLRVPSS
jgi:cbb3-type cytochrome oxidase maturation protein